MNPHVPTADRSLVDTLDRILDKGIVIDSLMLISLEGAKLPAGNIQAVHVEKISVQTSGQHAREPEDLANLFPFWRRDLWSK